MASKKSKHGSQPHMQGPEPQEGHPENQASIPPEELQNRYRSLDNANSTQSAFAGSRRRKNNSDNGFVRKHSPETQVENG
jgi:hypothetical protein